MDGLEYTAWTNLSPRRIEISVSGTVSPSSKSPLVELWVSGMKISHPSQPTATAIRNGGDFVLNLLKDNPGGTAGSADVSFNVSDTGFGYQSTGVQAVVALPGVEYGDEYSTGSGPVLNASYWISSAGGYDWSAFPPTAQNAIPGLDFLTWTEKPVERSVPGRIAFGIDHNQQSVDDRNTFVAGALVGLAGAALIAAFQELLHTPLVRRRERGEPSATEAAP